MADPLAGRADEYLRLQEELFVHEPDGLLYNWINLRTRKPFRADELPDDIVYRCRSGMPDALTWINGENTICKTGFYLAAMSMAYELTGEERYLAIAQRQFGAIYTIFELTAELLGETGWIPKAFGWIPQCAYSHDMNGDQMDPVMAALLQYSRVAPEPDRGRAAEVVTAVVDMLMRWDYCVTFPFTGGMSGGRGSLWDTPNINEQPALLTWLLLAEEISGESRYRDEYERVLAAGHKGNLLNLTRVQMSALAREARLENVADLAHFAGIPAMDEPEVASLPPGEKPEDYVLAGGGWYVNGHACRYLADRDEQRADHWRGQLRRWWEDEISCTYVAEHRAGYLSVYRNPTTGRLHHFTPRIIEGIPPIRRNFLSWCKGNWLHTGDYWAAMALYAWELLGEDSMKQMVLGHLTQATPEDMVWIKDPSGELPPQSAYLADCFFGPSVWLYVY